MAVASCHGSCCVVAVKGCWEKRVIADEGVTGIAAGPGGRQVALAAPEEIRVKLRRV